jgi:site-specific DNA-methyltransferase (adenine-specific)
VQLSEDEFKRLPSHLQVLFRKRPNSGSDEVLDLFPETTSGSWNGQRTKPKHNDIYGKYGTIEEAPTVGSTGSAARFFYCAKASKADRAGSNHPTVKPVKLMQWLCRMLTPPGGTVLDPFAGSGTTGAAAILEGFNVILIEREAEYVADIRRRLTDLDISFGL